jgi:uncharacterized protein (DUF362 family)
MKRRTFLKTFSAGVIGAGLARPHALFALPADSAPMLAAVRGENPASITAAAIEAIGGISKFISRGDIVVIKPNMAWDRTPELAANTNPDVVAQMVKLAFDAGAKKVKVFDNTCNSARRVYERSGIAESARQAGAEVSFTEERKFTKTKMNGEKLTEWAVYRDALEADKIINVAIAKHHTLARYTLSMKNLMGLIGGARNLLHQGLDTNIADLAAFFKPSLVVLDAVRVLTANGPQGGNLKDVKTLNTVAACADQVAIDAYGSTLFGLESTELSYVRKAHERGLGEMHLDKINVIEKTI